MDASQAPSCPVCHAEVRVSDYFCYNCGKNLHARPLSTSPSHVALLILGSIAVPPMGIIWGIRYLRQEDRRSKIVGMSAIILTVVELVLAVAWSVRLINTINDQVNKQLQMYQGF